MTAGAKCKSKDGVFKCERPAGHEADYDTRQHEAYGIGGRIVWFWTDDEDGEDER